MCQKLSFILERLLREHKYRTGGEKTAMANNSSNDLVISKARAALEQLKLETASELGIPNYAQTYKGDLPSRVNGSVGGYMVKKMIALAESQLSGSQ